MYVGLTNGKIFQYRKKNQDAKLLIQPETNIEMVQLTSASSQHKVITTQQHSYTIV